MSMKQHELNILKNVIEKAENISERLQQWAIKLQEFIKKEIAEEEAAEAKLKAEQNLNAEATTGTLSGAGAIDAVASQAVADPTPTPAAPEAPVEGADAQPPVNNDHVAEGAEQFTETNTTTEAATEATEASAATPPDAALSPSTASE